MEEQIKELKQILIDLNLEYFEVSDAKTKKSILFDIKVISESIKVLNEK